MTPANSNAQQPPLTWLLSSLQSELTELRDRAERHGLDIAAAAITPFCARMLVKLAGLQSWANEHEKAKRMGGTTG